MCLIKHDATGLIQFIPNVDAFCSSSSFTAIPGLITTVSTYAGDPSASRSRGIANLFIAGERDCGCERARTEEEGERRELRLPVDADLAGNQIEPSTISIRNGSL
jgi:hypothetical protein